jgi:hypothetical protein
MAAPTVTANRRRKAPGGWGWVHTDESYARQEAREQVRERQKATMRDAARSAAICGGCGRLLAPTDSITLVWHNFGRRHPHWKRVPICLLCTLDEMKPSFWGDTDHPNYLFGTVIQRARCLNCSRPMRVYGFRLSRNARCCCDDCRRKMRNARNKLRRRVRHKPIICPCGETFTPTRADAVFCSARCRQRQHRIHEHEAAMEAELTDLNRGKKPLRKTLRLRAIEATLKTTARRHHRARGRLQRAILDQLHGRSSEPLTCDDIAAEISHDRDTDTTRAERVSILRAMHAIVRKFPRYALAGGKGRTPLYLYEPGNERSAEDYTRPLRALDDDAA